MLHLLKHSLRAISLIGTFGKGKKNPYRRSGSQESEEQPKSEVREPVKEKPVQRNSKIYKCASSDDIISGGANRWGAVEENLYEPLNKDMNGESSASQVVAKRSEFPQVPSGSKL